MVYAAPALTHLSDYINCGALDRSPEVRFTILRLSPDQQPWLEAPAGARLAVFRRAISCLSNQSLLDCTIALCLVGVQ